jgi:hypothetical protein
MRSLPSLDIYLVPWSVLLRAILASLGSGKLAKVSLSLQPSLSPKRSSVS